MRILLSVLLLLLLPLFINAVSAQDEQSKSAVNTHSGFYAGLYFAPTYLPTPPPYRYYAYGVPGEPRSKVFTGLQAGYLYKNFISAQLGIEFGSVKYSSDNARMYTRGAPILSHKDNIFKSEYEVDIYQIPFLIKTFLSNENKKIRFYLPLGIVYRKQIANEVLREYSPENKIVNEYKATLTDQFWSLNIAGGFQYSLTERISIFAEPTSRFSFWFISNEGDKNNYNLPSYSINIGANYNF